MVLPECNERREIEIPDCKEANPDDCNRAFHLYLPSILCGDGRDRHRRGLQPDDSPRPGSDDENEAFPNSMESIGTLPLIFAIHCYGCTAAALTTFVDHANSHNAVLVLPEGLQSSFNARHCCGYALEKEIDDVGFLKHIQSTLSDEFSFIQSDYSYAVGWSNGGFLVMHAASLFRSISPISGHIYEIDPALKKSGTFCVDGICVDAPGAGKSMFLHHGVDDSFVRPTGCCNDPNFPKCCCSIVADTCVPVMDVAQNWALEVNGCELAERELAEKEETDGKKEEIDEGEGSKDEKGGGDERGGEKGKEKGESTVSGAKFVTSYSDKGIECLTTTGKDCKANTTICLHENSGHFNKPSFSEAFPFAKEVISFFAKDACEINDGKWNETSSVCACPENRRGAFCLDDPIVAEKSISIVEVDGNDFYIVDSGASSAGSGKVVLGFILFALATFAYVRHRYKAGKKKDDRYIHDVIEEEMEEATELVSSSGLYAN
ncbi:hypothetical protein ACHAXR_005522 [Thalassiosira sp. AJA248-18]